VNTPEKNLWKRVKKYTPEIRWSRIETATIRGFPDLVGYANECGYFTVELKHVDVTKSNKPRKPKISSHQISYHITHPRRSFMLVSVKGLKLPKLYEALHVPRIAEHGLSACEPIACASWSEIQDTLLARPRA